MDKSNALSTYITMPSVQRSIQDAMGESSQQFVANLAALISANPKIAECEPKTVIGACLVAASLKLSTTPGIGEAHIIPYSVSGKLVAQFQPGWKAFVQLALRTEKYEHINTTDVREGEYLSLDRITGVYKFNWVEDEEKREKLPISGYLAYFELHDGFSKMLYWSADKIQKHGIKYSKSFKTGKWTTDFDDMARKTVIKQLLDKWGYKSAEIREMIKYDQAVIADGNVKYLDNQPETPEEYSAEKEKARIIAHIENSKTVEELARCYNELPDDDAREQYKLKLELLNKEVK